LRKNSSNECGVCNAGQKAEEMINVNHNRNKRGVNLDYCKPYLK
jgi:hypothetical protein